MEEWLRCNTCFRPMKNSSCVFYLTGCDHAFCSYCIDGVSKPECPKCDSVGAGIIPVRETSLQQTMCGLESVSSQTKLLIESPQFCRVQYLIISRYAEEKDQAYVKLINFTDQLIVSVKLSAVSQKRLKKYHAKYRHLSTDDAPPTKNERNVPMMAKPTSDILSNNARSQVCCSSELPQKSNHDPPQLDVPKSEHFPKNTYRNGTEVPQTSIYDYPQLVGRTSEYLPKNSQPQLDKLNLEYSSNKSRSCHQISIKRANPSNPSFFFKKRRVDENIWSQNKQELICDYSQQKALSTEYSSAGARLIDTSSLNYGQSKNCATKSHSYSIVNSMVYSPIRSREGSISCENDYRFTGSQRTNVRKDFAFVRPLRQPALRADCEGHH